MRDTRREGAVGRNIGSAAFVSRHVRCVEAFSAVRLPKDQCPAGDFAGGERQESCAKISA